ncbi:DEAD/DEAH box helicase [Oleiharenicola lentus]|uniref:DEAD/DEAH box helicase n=1 Tax=Oleiharenicola lentus TaxID=2508720 RepID=UPI001C555027|nr:DEAD/DEAH box helicase [Oleiharenicola lentus]
MFRKLLSKITQTLKGGTKSTESARPAHPPKPSRAGGRDHRPRQEKKAPRTDAPKAAPSAPRAASAGHHAPAAHAPKPLPEVPKLDTSFTALGLGDRIAYAVQQKGYENPTPIQAQAIPVVLAGKDVIGSAQTGTGKTAAFSLPILQKLGTHGAGLRCLVLEPTRELALQVEESFKEYSKFTDLRTTVIYGGVGYGKQREELARRPDTIVATPGRLLDFMEQNEIRLDKVEVLVLDEVDRMLDMGFLPDVKRIVAKVAKNRQTLFFTATLPPEIEQLAAWALRDPFKIAVARERSTAETITHAFYPVVQAQKFDLLVHLLEQTEYKSVIIFSRTKSGADYVASRLQRAGHTCAVMHSDRSQQERVDALKGFKSGKHEVLVATDIAARGLDIAGVSHVINFDVPENPEDYVHRIGRTGRAQNTGDAFTLVTEETWRDARSIERFISQSIPWKKIEGFNYTYSGIFDGGGMPTAAPEKPKSRLSRGGRR